MKIALISEVFTGVSAAERLAERLREAKARGAELALLPELPLNGWSPATRVALDEDAEPPDGPRHQLLRSAAREASIGLVGGVIVKDNTSHRRYSVALAFTHEGTLAATYRKVHLPEEEGFWETSHYEPGDALSPVIDAFSLRVGLQICSDINRPQGCQLLGAMGAEVILNPRATEAATYDRWRTVLTANALTSGAYVLSVNRPREEGGVKLGGPSFGVAPTGEILAETTEPVCLVTLDRKAIERARGTYPGYLAVRSDLYAEGWKQVPRTVLPHR
jgi:N-carbamoylputrescine amidase